MQNRIVLTLTFIFTAFCLYGQSQSAQSKKNQPIRFYMPKGYWERIDFYDTLSGTLLCSFDVMKSNPYNNFPYKVVKQGPRGVSYYEILDSAKSNLRYWVGTDRTDNASSDVVPYYVTNDFTSSGFPSGARYLAVAYRMFTYNGKDSLIATHSTYYILSPDGNIISTFNHVIEKTRPIYVVISYSGKYMCITRSNHVKFGALRKTEVEIYDTKTLKSLYKTIIQETDEEMSPLPVDENSFMCDVYLHEKGELLRVFDVEKRVVYEKLYSRDDYDHNIKKVGRYGIVLKTNETVMEKYTEFLNKKIDDK